MATIAEQKAEALEDLKLYGQWQAEPALELNELNRILANCQRAVIWTANQLFEYGRIVIPTLRNGHRYRCIESGTSGPAEPDWPRTNGRTVVDGTGIPRPLRWEEDGPDWPNVYDVELAIYQALRLHAQKSAQLSGTELNQVYDHWVKEAELWAPAMVA